MLPAFHLKLDRCRLLVWASAVLLGGAAMAETHKVRVSSPDLAATLVSQGARLIADYGSFQLMDADDAQLAGLRRDRVRVADEYNLIQLNARSLDTRRPAVQALRRPVGQFGGKRLHLVQFAGPVKPEWIEALQQKGASVIGHVPQNAYLVYGTAESLARIQSWARTAGIVQWEGAFAEEDKVHPRARAVDEKGSPQKPGTDLFAVQMLEDAGANATTLALIDQLKLEPVKRDFRLLHYRNVIVRLPPGRLARLAAQPEVVSIQPYHERKKMDERQNQIMAGNLTAGMPSGPGYLAWLAGRGFTQAQFDASGFVVDVSDSGIDNGTLSPGHFGLYQQGNPEQPSRIAYSRLEGTPHSGSTLEGCDGHGSLNAHIVGGYVALNSSFPHADAEGYYYGLGVCPFVKIGASVVFDPDVFTFPSYPNLQADAYHDGTRISANSWGADVDGIYDVDAQTYDALVRDAQPSDSTYPADGNQQMVIVFSAGNAGPTTGSVGSPSSAKNVITVGASENVRSLSTTNGGYDSVGTDGCDAVDTDADIASDLIPFSSRGPCWDGRMKPDLVAPGTHITGGVGQSGDPSTNGTGLAISCFSADGVCALPGGGSGGNPNNFFPLGQEFYTVSSGTSHSTPAVAGACALLRQYFLNQELPAPSPAMTKACLMNSTRYLTGAGANDTLWSPGQGMGSVDLGMTFDGVIRLLHDQLSYEKFTATGQTRNFIGTISDPFKPFRVTLAWTDAPGVLFANAYNNDLDLTVTVGGNTYKGNVFSGAVSVTDGAYDEKNNVESVFLPAGLSGEFLITVAATSINSDGVPNEDPVLDQDFALVAYNAAETLTSVITPLGYSLAGEGYSPTNGAVDPGETVTVAFALMNAGNLGTANLVATLLETNGVVAPCSPQVFGVIPASGGIATQFFSFTAVGACGDTIRPTLELRDGATDLGLVGFPIHLGQRVITITTATNSQYTSVPAYGTVGSAAPFPTPISISGVTGTVSKVTVTLTGMTHSFPDDLDVLLVGPTGTNVMLMSDCGGGNGLADATLTFDDAAAGAVPDSAQIVSGSYKPSDYGPVDSLSSPAPASPFGLNLSVFNGLDPNGNWLLYVQDDFAQDTGDIALGWRISITTSDAVCSGAANQRPVLTPIANRMVHAGTTVIVSNSATDPDIPTNILCFSLETNAPANAVIDMNSGVLTWTPQPILEGTTNTITVKVTDNGLPPLSDTQSFAVVVAPPPFIQSIIRSNNSVRLTWSAISGQTYRVQYKPGLGSMVWLNLLPDVTATGPFASKSDPINAQVRRFYRVMVLP